MTLPYFITSHAPCEITPIPTNNQPMGCPANTARNPKTNEMAGNAVATIEIDMSIPPLMLFRGLNSKTLSKNSK